MGDKEPEYSDAMTAESEKKFDEWRQENMQWLQMPAILSLLYDLNRLPEVAIAFNSIRKATECILIVEHFKRFHEDMTKNTSTVNIVDSKEEKT